jgi:hypothetical protein
VFDRDLSASFPQVVRGLTKTSLGYVYVLRVAMYKTEQDCDTVCVMAHCRIVRANVEGTCFSMWMSQ